MLKMYLNTKYKILFTNVFKYKILNTLMYLNTFVNTFYIIFKISSLFIQSVKNLKMNEILYINLDQLHSMSII